MLNVKYFIFVLILMWHWLYLFIGGLHQCRPFLKVVTVAWHVDGPKRVLHNISNKSYLMDSNCSDNYIHLVMSLDREIFLIFF